MPRVPLPPMTSKQAKKLHKKAPAQPYFTPSQIRVLDRREEQETKRKEALEAERKRKINKRKRELKDEREREAKRQQVEEGKLPQEALWGKVTSSQPRLSVFMVRPVRREDSETASISECDLIDECEILQRLEPDVRRDSTSNRGERKDSEVLHLNDSITIAEDETAEPLDKDISERCAGQDEGELIVSSPTKSVRLVLSPMSQTDINIRAQQKPDISSTPPPNCGLRSPEKAPPSLSQTVAETMAMIGTQDFADEDNIVTDKENEDPTFSPSKKISSQNPPSLSTSEKPVTCTKAKVFSGFGDFSDCEDLFDFEDEDDDEFTDGLDDETLLSLVATQKPKSNVVVNKLGSPKKLSPSRDAFPKVPVLAFSPTKRMPPPARKPLSRTPSLTTGQPVKRPFPESVSFSSIADDDLLELASQLEADNAENPPTNKRKRRLPWQENPLPPPSTQELMLELVEEYEAELE